jgi:hypothetical protein
MPAVDPKATLGHPRRGRAPPPGPPPDHAYATASTFRANRGPILQKAETQLSVESDYFTDYETDEEIATAADPVMTGVRHDFQDNTWSQDSFTYDPKPREFNGSQGPHSFFAGIPTILQLFELFWPCTLLHKIVQETNRYATRPLDA